MIDVCLTPYTKGGRTIKLKKRPGSTLVMSDEQQTMMKEGGAVLVPCYISACPVAGGSEDWTPAQ